MTPDELITELLGSGWQPSILPLFLNELKKAFDDANRYYFIRDFAKELSFNNVPRSREELELFDRMLDEKQKKFY
jgi:hypothetical protein